MITGARQAARESLAVSISSCPQVLFFHAFVLASTLAPLAALAAEPSVTASVTPSVTPSTPAPPSMVPSRSPAVSPPQSPTPPGTLVDKVVAVVDQEVITQSDLYVEARIAIAYRQGPQAAALDLDDDLLSSLLEYVVDQVLVAAQARRVGAPEVPDDDVEARWRVLVQRFPSVNAFRAFLRRFGISDAAVKRLLRRDLRNDRYIAQQMRTRLMGADLSDHSEDAQQHYAEALRNWLGELRGGVEIRGLGDDGLLELQQIR